MLNEARWRKNFEDALQRIHAFRNDPNADMRLLTHWLMDTDTNPYWFLESRYAGMLESAEQFATLLGMIHHSIVDDGEISFVAVNGRPMIVFANRDEIGHVELRSEMERMADEKRGAAPSYDFIDGVSAFIDRQNRYEAHKAALIDLSDKRRMKTITIEEWRSEWQRLVAAYAESNRQSVIAASPSSC
jgi:hypothetical protein